MNTADTPSPLDVVDTDAPRRPSRGARLRLATLIITGVLIFGAGTAFAIDRLTDVAGDLEGY